MLQIFQSVVASYQAELHTSYIDKVRIAASVSLRSANSGSYKACCKEVKPIEYWVLLLISKRSSFKTSPTRARLSAANEHVKAFPRSFLSTIDHIQLFLSSARPPPCRGRYVSKHWTFSCSMSIRPVYGWRMVAAPESTLGGPGAADETARSERFDCPDDAPLRTSSNRCRFFKPVGVHCRTTAYFS